MLYAPDTIVALATPPGEGAIGIIRLSGPQASSLLHQVFQGSTPVDSFESHHLYFGRIHHPHQGIVLDEGLVAWMKSPHSFTGEDLVEFQLHGSPLNLSRIIKVLISLGARLAEPGEFSKRAYLNQKMDLSQAEAIADLISAHSDLQAQNALRQMGGYLSKTIHDIRLQLNECLALIEIGFDFSDQDLSFVDNSKIINLLENIYLNIDKFISTYQTGQFLRQGLKVALIGKPNVGKSSLMNALLQEDKSIIHPSAGTTRDVVSGQFFLKGIPIYLYDTAGIRDTSDEVELLGVQRSLAVLQKADLVLLLLDSSRPLELEDEVLWSQIQNKPHLIVLTKADLPFQWSEIPFKHSSGVAQVSLSAKNLMGLDVLKDCIENKFLKDVQNYDQNYVLNNVRHYKSLEQAVSLLKPLLDQLKQRQIQEECVVEELRRLSEILSEITGEVSSETVLDEIFSKFCIGK